MDNNILDYFKQRLLNEKMKYDKVIQLMKENGSGEQDGSPSSELSSYDNHPAELGTEVFQITMNNALKVNEEFSLNQIEDALERIEEGIYGICEICKKEIDRERLEVLPFAKKCMVCENNYQSQFYNNNNRPAEEDIIGSPYGRKYLNRRCDDEHEGMDYFHDLMKYGSADSPQDLGGYNDYDDYYTNEVDRQGEVDKMDNISNEDYKKQLPD